jgi:hypothetical protein
MKLIIPGTLVGFRTTADRTIKFTVESQEISGTNVSLLHNLLSKYVKCLLSDSNISSIEESMIDEEKLTDGRKIKSKAQRLRAVLFKLHEQTQTNQTFDEFYNERMEALIEHFKSKLND